jgi:hypothetical protein
MLKYEMPLCLNTYGAFQIHLAKRRKKFTPTDFQIFLYFMLSDNEITENVLNWVSVSTGEIRNETKY